MKTNRCFQETVAPMDGADELTAACVDLGTMAIMIGREQAFLQVQRAWPTLTRDTLMDMLGYSEQPSRAKLKRLVNAFAGAMIPS